MMRTSTIAIIGRVLVAAVFIYSGIGKIMTPAMTQGYIASVGLPAPLLAYIVAVVIEVGGGFMLLVGYQTRIVSLVIAVFTLATALFFHNHLADQNQMFNFLKNVAMIGGLLQITAFGGGAFSLDGRRAPAEVA